MLLINGTISCSVSWAYPCNSEDSWDFRLHPPTYIAIKPELFSYPEEFSFNIHVSYNAFF